MANTIASQVQELYVGYLGRAAEKAGLDYWVNQVSTGKATIQAVAQAFTVSTEYTTAYGSLPTAALVAKVYQNVLGRPGEAAGLAYWETQITSGKITAGQLVNTMLNNLGSIDQATINNKVFVAQTYTDTVGANYNVAAGTSVIAKVDGTAASVSTAISSIENGTVGGLVPGVSLINAVTASTAAITAYEKSVATTNAAFDTLKADGTPGKDGAVTSAEATVAANAANTARFDAVTGVSVKATAALVSDAKTAADAAAAAKAVVVATTGGPAALATYEAALAAQKALVGTTAATAAKTALEVATDKANADAAAALAALDVAVAAGTQTTYAKLTAANGTAIANATDLEAALNAPASATKTAFLAELAKVTDFAPKAIETVAKKAAFVKAAADVDTADNAAVLTTSGYLTKLAASDAAAALVVKAQAADAAVDAAKVVTDKFAALNNTDAVAKAALQTFITANADKVAISDIAGTSATTQATAKADVFYFGSKAVAANDFAIGGTINFGTGDSIVLGSGYTFNSGALSTGNANTLEFFLVKGATGTQVVIETEAYGNSTTTVDAAGTVTASANATVINLVGVTADHLSVANGVISYV